LQTVGVRFLVTPTPATGSRYAALNPAAIRCEVEAEVAIRFAALAKQQGDDSAGLVRRLVNRAVQVGPGGKVDLGAIEKEIEAELAARLKQARKGKT
jgi:hypothetical protein